MRTRTSNDYLKLSLASITLTAVMTGVHHVYRLGWGVLIPFALIVILPYLLVRWFRQSGQKAVIWIYGLLNTLIVLWFGIIDGFLDHVLKALGLENLTFLPGGEAEVVKTAFSLWSPAAGNFFYEGTGILTFIASMFALYFGYKFLQARRASAAGNRAPLQLTH